ncbi:hypothetical protein M9H77_26544 [Catharanthus roseus]|uniref:Uncharacterized protein n=1 Tax=Catharanthus roseus TaxID=4058 RepID=A0ACC0AE14_CATRO|nr:hypothetical protein M9H77_26544 [Catharanthus roseus]
MQGRNTVEEVLCLSAKRDYTVFYKNHEDNNMHSDIVVIHLTSVEMLITWPYIFIMDTTYKTNKHYLRMSHGLPCACELITRFDYVLPIQLSDIDAFWKTLEISGHHPSARQQDMDFEMRSLTDILHRISTGPISKVREMHRLANCGSGSDSGTGSGSWSGSGSRRRGRPSRAPRGRDRGCDRGRSSLFTVIHASSCSTFPYTNTFPAFIYPFISNWKHLNGDGNCSYQVVADFVFGDEYQWPEVCRRMLYELEHSTNVYVNLVGLELGSTIVLPLYSYSDRPGGTLVIGLLTEQQQFIQLQLNDMCLIPPLHVQWILHRTE